jgi:hypothetical protein
MSLKISTYINAALRNPLGVFSTKATFKARELEKILALCEKNAARPKIERRLLKNSRY